MFCKTEKRILNDIVKKIAHTDKDAWQQLKWEIFDYGYQSYYPAQSEFEFIAKRFLNKLPEFGYRKLIQLWKLSNPDSQNSDDEIIDICAYMISEQIVARARTAAMRINNW